MLITACGGEFHTPSQDVTVGLSARAEQRNDNNTTLTVTRMRLVVASLELLRDDGTAVGFDGPFLVDPKLDGSWTRIAEQPVAHGAYTALVLTLRPLSANVAADVTASHAAGFDDLLSNKATMAFEGEYGPEGQLAPYSVMLSGTTQNTLALRMSWNVKLGADANVTLSTQLKEWFARDASGHPIDPRSADADDALRAFSSELEAGPDDDRSGGPSP